MNIFNWSLVELNWCDNWSVLQISKPSIIPAIEVDPPGCLFNPSSESHQVLCWYAMLVYFSCGTSVHTSWDIKSFHLYLLFIFWLQLGCFSLCCCRRDAESLQKWVGTSTSSFNSSRRSYWRRCESCSVPFY